MTDTADVSLRARATLPRGFADRDALDLAAAEAMMAKIDHSKPDGQRNRAIIETMYSCGLRVSETVNLCFSWLYLDVGFIRVIGKGNK